MFEICNENGIGLFSGSWAETVANAARRIKAGERIEVADVTPDRDGDCDPVIVWSNCGGQFKLAWADVEIRSAMNRI